MVVSIIFLFDRPLVILNLERLNDKQNSETSMQQNMLDGFNGSIMNQHYAWVETGIVVTFTEPVCPPLSWAAGAGLGVQLVLRQAIYLCICEGPTMHVLNILWLIKERNTRPYNPVDKLVASNHNLLMLIRRTSEGFACGASWTSLRCNLSLQA